MTAAIQTQSAHLDYVLRLADRVQAWEDGAWVREAALAHAEKQRRRDRLAA
jgi:hypothetical protein